MRFRSGISNVMTCVSAPLWYCGAMDRRELARAAYDRALSIEPKLPNSCGHWARLGPYHVQYGPNGHVVVTSHLGTLDAQVWGGDRFRINRFTNVRAWAHDFTLS